jgi:hypothetical protein
MADNDSSSRQPMPVPSLLETEEELVRFVRAIHDEIQRQQLDEKTTALRQALLESRDAVLTQLTSVSTTTPPRCYPRRLPTNGEAIATRTSTEDWLFCQLCDNNNDDDDDDNNNNNNNDNTHYTEQTTVTVPVAANALRFPDAVASQSVPDEVPSSSLCTNPTVTVKLRVPKANKWLATSLSSIPIEGTRDPTPSSTTTIFLKAHYATEDEQDLSYVPYFGDDDKEDVVSEHFNTEQREKMMEVGPEYKERATDHVIDQVLHVIQQRLGETPSARLQKRIQSALATILDTKHVSHRNFFPKNEASSEKKAPKAPYLAAVDSYRECFCRRCFIYDCNMHNNLVKPDLQLQAELAIAKWKVEEEQETDVPASKKKSSTSSDPQDMEVSNDDEAPPPPPPDAYDASSQPLAASVARLDEWHADMKELDPFQKSLCEHSFLIHQGDVNRMAISLGAPRRLVEAHVREQGFSLPEFQHVDPKRRKISKSDKTMRQYNPTWLKRVEGAEIHPFFVPCHHSGPCNAEHCSCVQNAFFCTKHCVRGDDDNKNFFRGCACKGGKCQTKACPCFAAKRECDPDLCLTCGACTDPPNQLATKQQRCRNDRIGMRRHAHLLLAASTIEDAGWGVYTKHALKKGDFVHEYVGEVISQEEAERRGSIYDKVNQSYLFNLSSDYVVDASRKGNKTRFANHSTKPNCETKMIWVNGDIRIGLFAIVDIEPQTEVSLRCF